MEQGEGGLSAVTIPYTYVALLVLCEVTGQTYVQDKKGVDSGLGVVGSTWPLPFAIQHLQFTSYQFSVLCCERVVKSSGPLGPTSKSSANV